MAVRTVSVLLTADIAAFRARMGEASRQANRTSRDIRTSMRNAGDTLTRVSSQQRNALKAVQTASVGLIAAFGFAVAASARFEKAMASVKAVTQANASQMGKLRAAALEAGRTTAYSASQAAEAEFELAKAGISAADIVGGALKGSLDLAAAAQLDLGESAEIAATTMTVFGLKGKDVSHVADVLAAAANKSATDVHQLGLSMKMTGQVAAQTGLSLEDTVGAMALFAAEGLKGSDAGTSFKVMLQRLTPQSQEAQATMDRLGFSAYDANGSFVGLQEVAKRMKESFANLTPEARNAAMGVIFGSDAVRAAGILYKHGADGVRTYTDAVNDQGYAAAVAQTKMDHLLGDLELLKSALETALIETGSAANSALRDMVQWVTRLINVYNGLPPGLQQTVGLLTGLAGAIGLVGASMLLLLPRILLVRRELIGMGVTAQTVRAQMMTLSKMGLVIGTLATIAWGVGKLGDTFRGEAVNVGKLTNAMVDFARQGKATGELSETFGKDLDGLGEAVARLAHPGAWDRIQDSLHTISHFGLDDNAALEDARDKIKGLDEALASLVASGNADIAHENFRAYAEAAEASGTSTEKFRSLLPGYADALVNSDTQTKLAAEGQGALGDATAMTADELADERTEAEKLADALNTLNGVAITAAEGQISFEESLDTLSETARENGASLDVTGEKGRAVKSAFLDSAKAAQEYAQTVADQKGSIEAGNAVLEKNIAALRRTMKAAGFTDKQIKNLIGTYARIPPKTTTQIVAETENAMRDLQTVQQKVKNTKGKKITVDALTEEGQKALEDLGYKIKHTKGKKVTITVPTGSQKSAVDALRSAIEALRDKHVTVTTTRRETYITSHIPGPMQKYYRKADGGIVGRARDGLYLPGYAPRRDTELILASKGEGVLVPETVRKLGALSGLGPAGVIKSLNSWGRYGSPLRMADGGLVRASGGTRKGLTRAQAETRRELPGDLGDLRRSLTKSASEIRSASKALATDLRKLGKSGSQLAEQVGRTSRRLQMLANRRDRVRERIQAARQFAGEQRRGAREFMALGEGDTAGALIKDLKGQQRAAEQFQRDVNLLRKRGLHKDLLAQVIAEGPGGDLTKRIMTASSAEFQQLNRLAKKGAGIAKSIGRTTADAMFDSGKNASKGFLAGLISQEKALTRQMNKLADALINALKKKLKMHSPSVRASDEVGLPFGKGVAKGVDLSVPDVQASAHRLSAAMISSAYTRPPAAPAASGGQFTGSLYLDSGEFLGAVKGSVTPMIRDSEQRQAYRARAGRR